MSSDTVRSRLSAHDAGLPETARRELLHMARAVLRRCTGVSPVEEIHAIHPALNEMRGVFVTLTRGGALRGCIGNPHATIPLAEQVVRAAENAALRDPRFPPVEAEELDEIQIEISLLSEMRVLKNAGDIEIGRHGLYVQRDIWSGLLLPKVAVRFGWDAETFLGHVCEKAGLHSSAWQEPETRVWLFEAEVFGED